MKTEKSNSFAMHDILAAKNIYFEHRKNMSSLVQLLKVRGYDVFINLIQILVQHMELTSLITQIALEEISEK
jgi:hypothetical protein